MTCVKTGCHIYLAEYREWAYGDAFEVDDVAIFHIVERGFEPLREVKHFTIHRLTHTFGPRNPTMDNTGILISGMGYWETHGYNGVPT
jgi:hypothetical protein